MNSYDLNAWLQALLRWFHVFAGILWIGQTYLFNFFEKNLERSAKNENVVGSLWMVHGGGFYFLEKQQFHQPMPGRLHWFKWEAGLTWLSGAALLALTYYMGGLLVDAPESYATGLWTGIGVLVFGWAAYDVLARTPLAKNEPLFAGFCFAAVLALHLGLHTVLSSRAAFFHIGALFGTIMAANVWMRIIPAQRKLIAATEKGEDLPAKVLAAGPQRSRHNSFMVVPLVFIMISSHYPTISYGSDYSTVVLGALLLLGWGAALVLRR